MRRLPLPDSSGQRVLDVAASAAVGAVVAAVLIWVDSSIDEPTIAASSARSLLGATVGALVTAGAFAFWMLPVAAQLAASSVPASMVATRLHDQFQRRVIATTITAMTYTGVVLLSLPPGGSTRAPAIATAVGGVLGVSAIASLLVAIRHAERSTRPGVLVTEAAHGVMDQLAQMAAASRPGDVVREPVGSVATSTDLVASTTGWVADVDEARLLRTVGPGTTVRILAGVGTFVVEGWTVVAQISPDQDGRSPEAEDCRSLAECFRVTPDRSAQTDLAGSLVRFTDIGVHAARGGTGSPSTIYEVLWYLAAILHALIRHDVQTTDRRVDGGRIVQRGSDPSAADLAHLAVDRIRQVTSDDPPTTIELVRVLADTCDAAASAGRRELVDVLEQQADLAVEQCARAGPLPHDLDRVIATRRRHTAGHDVPAGREEEYPTRARSSP